MRLEKLKEKTEIDKIFNRGEKIFSPYFVCYIVKEKEQVEKTNYLIIASRKVGNAVKRNRAKRVLRVLVKNTIEQLEKANISNIILIATKRITEKKSTDLTEIFIKKTKKL